jgi:hypothetical protein
MTSQKRNSSQDRRDDRQDRNDIASQMSKLLESRRWEVQEGPFRGFDSPPGRF